MKWTEEHILETSATFKRPVDWLKAHQYSYRAAKRLGIFERCTAHMETTGHSSVLSVDQVLDTLAGYRKLSAWERDHRREANAARVNGWLDRVISRLDPVRRVPTPHRLTDDEIFDSSAMCVTKKEWRQASWRCYQAALWRGLFDACTAHMPFRLPKEAVYDDATILAALKSSETVQDFVETYPACAAALKRRGQFHELTSSLGWRLQIRAHIIYAYEFCDRHVYVGQTVRLRARDYTHRSGGPVFEHAAQLCSDIPGVRRLEEVDTPLVAVAENRWMENYAASGWVLLNRAAAGGLGSLSHGRKTPPRHLAGDAQALGPEGAPRLPGLPG